MGKKNTGETTEAKRFESKYDAKALRGCIRKGSTPRPSWNGWGSGTSRPSSSTCCAFKRRPDLLRGQGPLPEKLGPPSRQ